MNMFRSGPHSMINKVGRILWGTIWLFLYRPSPRIAHGWRRMLLRLFGAKIGTAAHPYPSAKVWAPWNLEMGNHSCLGDHTDFYCVDKIVIGHHSTVSHYSFLCTASHDYQDPSMPLITSRIIIGEHAWIAADVFVGPGVTIGDGAVVGARSSIFRDVEPWTVVAGNPARVIRKRESSSRV
jgi:putative colanic acid biosynthesis acetyltransferase WcaF